MVGVLVGIVGVIIIEMHYIYMVSPADATDRVLSTLIGAMIAEASEAKSIFDGMLFSLWEFKVLEGLALQD